MTLSETLRATIKSARRAWSFEELTTAHPNLNRASMHTALRALVESGDVLRTNVPTTKGGTIAYWRDSAVHVDNGSAFNPMARPRRLKYTVATVAEFVGALPATTATLATLLGIMPRQVTAIAARAKAVNIGGRWHPAGTAGRQQAGWTPHNDGIDTDAGSRSIEFVASTVTFECSRRGLRLTDAQCYDDHLNAECRMKGAPTECRGCPRGQRQRVEYAAGAFSSERS
jgi:hypothetical protein